MDHETFAAQVEALREKFRVITWDMPCHGRSSAIDRDLPFSETAAGFIRDLLDHLEIETAILAGLSLGSYVSQVAAHRYPKRIEATIHIGGGPLHPPVSPLVSMATPLIGFFVRLYPSKSIFRAFASHRALRAETRAYMERVAEESGKELMAHLTQELIRDMVRGLPEHTLEPKLLCHGDHETAFVRRQIHRWHREDPESHLRVIDDAHHVANQDNPEGTNRVILEFLESL